jgi:transposase
MQRRLFSKEFKLQVLHELEAGKTVAEVCRQHELKKDVVYRWKHEYTKNPGLAFGGRGNPSREETKVAELERTIGNLYNENAFLKRVVNALESRLDEVKKNQRRET